MNTPEQPNNPLHGVKLVTMVETLVEFFGWEKLGTKIT
ncbi:MAG: VF530 family protein, partial [Bacteroidetes bacterium]|nr:VF530 family protein [Bacteroidota bacterium]